MKKILLSALLLIPLALEAHDAPTIHYQVAETRAVESDLLAVKVNIQFSAKDAGAASEYVNKVALEVVDLAQTIEGVSVTSGGYQTWSQPYGKKSMGRVEWVVQQVLTLETQSFVPLLGKLGEIQRMGGVIQELTYSVSPQRKRAIEDQLKVKAITRFRERASEYALAAGRGEGQWALLTLNVGRARKEPAMPMARGMFAMESAQGVTAPAGTETLSATVSGAIALKDAEVNIQQQVQSLTEKVVEQLKQ